MPEGHTLYRLAREQTRLFVGRPVHVTSPQGRFAAGAALLDGRVLEGVVSHGKHLFAAFGPDTLHVHLGLYGSYATGTGVAPAARGALRMRWEGPGPDGTGVWTDLRGPTACEVLAAPEVEGILARLGPDPLRPRADGGRGLPPAPAPPHTPPRRRGPGLPADRRQPDTHRRAADGPVRAGRRRQRLPGRTALPARRLAVPPGARRGRRSLGRHVVGPGGHDAGRCAARPDRHHATGRPAPPSRPGAPGGRPLRLPAHRPAVPDLRDRGPHRGDGRPQPVLGPGLPDLLPSTIGSSQRLPSLAPPA